jgi:hypothetical protein
MAMNSLLRVETDLRPRLHAYVWDMMVYHAVLDKALRCVGGHEPYVEGGAMAFDCILNPWQAVLPLTQVFDIAFENIYPEAVAFDIAETRDVHLGVNTHGFNEVNHRHGAAAFSLFCEPNLDWLKAENSNYENWPPISNFCRVVRNALTHGNRVTINNAAAPELSWRGLTIGPVQNGEALLGVKLALGDLFLLAADFDEELTGLNAPVFDP